MPRPAPFSTSDTFAVRIWFNLTREELALFMGVSPTTVNSLETGRLRLTPALGRALRPLLACMPPPEAQAAAAQAAAADAAAPPPAAHLASSPPPPLPGGAAFPPDPADLALRRLECHHRAARLLKEAAALAHRARVVVRWQAALPALLPPDPAAPDPAGPAAPAPGLPPDRTRWLRGWLAWRARPLAPAEATRYYRLRAQAAGLLAEAAALAGGGTAGPGG